jgi:dTDP-D-glucose 4,6-dehydratase
MCQGVRGRNSDNTMIRAELGWEPLISIHEGMAKTIAWIKGQMAKEGGDAMQWAESKVVVQTTDSLDNLAN